MAWKFFTSAGQEKQTGLMSGTGYGTSLPASPTDGQEFVLVDSTSAPTYQWRFRYNAGSASAYKWEFVGGSPAYAETNNADATSSTTYVALANAGPSFTLPRAGDYEIKVVYESPGGSSNSQFMSYDVGGTGAIDADRAHGNAGATHVAQSNPTRKLGVAASSAIVSKYKSPGATGVTFQNRRLYITPIRVS